MTTETATIPRLTKEQIYDSLELMDEGSSRMVFSSSELDYVYKVPLYTEENEQGFYRDRYRGKLKTRTLDFFEGDIADFSGCTNGIMQNLAEYLAWLNWKDTEVGELLAKVVDFYYCPVTGLPILVMEKAIQGLENVEYEDSYLEEEFFELEEVLFGRGQFLDVKENNVGIYMEGLKLYDYGMSRSYCEELY